MIVFEEEYEDIYSSEFDEYDEFSEFDEFDVFDMGVVLNNFKYHVLENARPVFTLNDDIDDNSIYSNIYGDDRYKLMSKNELIKFIVGYDYTPDDFMKLFKLSTKSDINFMLKILLQNSPTHRNIVDKWNTNDRIIAYSIIDDECTYVDFNKIYKLYKFNKIYKLYKKHCKIYKYFARYLTRHIAMDIFKLNVLIVDDIHNMCNYFDERTAIILMHKMLIPPERINKEKLSSLFQNIINIVDVCNLMRIEYIIKLINMYVKHDKIKQVLLKAKSSNLLLEYAKYDINGKYHINDFNLNMLCYETMPKNIIGMISIDTLEDKLSYHKRNNFMLYNYDKIDYRNTFNKIINWKTTCANIIDDYPKLIKYHLYKVRCLPLKTLKSIVCVCEHYDINLSKDLMLMIIFKSKSFGSHVYIFDIILNSI
jgi:hypothetical protein